MEILAWIYRSISARYRITKRMTNNNLYIVLWNLPPPTAFTHFRCPKLGLRIFINEYHIYFLNQFNEHKTIYEICGKYPGLENISTICLNNLFWYFYNILTQYFWCLLFSYNFEPVVLMVGTWAEHLPSTTDVMRYSSKNIPSAPAWVQFTPPVGTAICHSEAMSLTLVYFLHQLIHTFSCDSNDLHSHSTIHVEKELHVFYS